MASEGPSAGEAPDQVRIELADADADDEQLQTAGVRLRRELLLLDVDGVQPLPSGHAPAGARSAELAAAAGIFIVSGLRTRAVLDGLLSTVRSWSERGKARSVKLTIEGDTIELTGASDDDQRRLIEIWLRRHEQGGS
jgi:hypothetical protein